MLWLIAQNLEGWHIISHLSNGHSKDVISISMVFKMYAVVNDDFMETDILSGWLSHHSLNNKLYYIYVLIFVFKQTNEFNA